MLRSCLKIVEIKDTKSSFLFLILVFFEVTKRKRNVLNKFERGSVGVYKKNNSNLKT